jgi:hypothetical protein
MYPLLGFHSCGFKKNIDGIKQFSNALLFHCPLFFYYNCHNSIPTENPTIKEIFWKRLS